MGETLEALRDLHIIYELWGIGRSIDRLREEQWEATNTIVASVDTVREAVVSLQASVDSHTQILHGVAAQLDVQAHILSRILDVVSRPLETRARELREIGERRLQAGLDNEALEAFLESTEEYPDDFTCHYAVAVIQYERLDNPEAAWASCEDALAFAKTFRGAPDDPTPAYFSSRSILLAGRILEDGGLAEEALAYYQAACATSPDYGECFRRLALVAAKLQRDDLATSAARVAVLIDTAEAALLQKAAPGVFDGVLASQRTELEQTATALAEVVELAVPRYARLSEALVSSDLAAAWEQLDSKSRRLFDVRVRREDRMSEERRAFGASRQRGGLIDLDDARQGLWALVDEVHYLARQLEPPLIQASTSLQHRARQNLDATLEWAEGELREARAMISTSAMIEGWGCLVFLYGFFAVPIGGLMLVAGINRPELGLTLVGSAILLSWFIPLLLRDLSLRIPSRARQRNANEVLVATGDTHDRAVGTIKEAKAALDGVKALESQFHAAAEAVDLDDIKCDLIIVAAGQERDDYDENELAESLQVLFRSYAPAPNPSLQQLKELVRATPCVFLRSLSVSDAEGIAAYLQRDFAVSMGIRRRYVGELPL